MQTNQPISSVGSLDNDVKNLAIAIRQTESGGDFKAKGKSGEYGAYQFTEPTWNSYAQKHLGKVTPLKQATPEQQNEVAYKQLKEWKDKGFNPGQIASMWNAGEGEPDAYTGKFSNGASSSGVNKYNVKFNVPDYAKSVATAYQKIKAGQQVGMDAENPSSVSGAQEEKEGLVKSIFRGVTQPVMTMLARPLQAGAMIAGASDEGINDYFSKVPFYGKGGRLDIPKTGKDLVKDAGRAIQTASLALPVNGFKQAVGLGAVSGLGAGLEADPSLMGGIKGAGIGTVAGTIGGGISKALGALPKWLTGSAFNGLDDAQVEKVLRDKSMGSTRSILNQSQKAISGYGQTIDDMLQKTAEKGSPDFALRATQSQFPEKSTENIFTKIRNLIPSGNKAGLEGIGSDRGTILRYLENIKNGTATLFEKNKVRIAIDSATKGDFARMARALRPTAGHDLAMTFADALRSEIQNSVKETIPIFDEFAKEMGIRNFLKKMVESKGSNGILQWRDMVPFILGNEGAGIPGGAAAVAAERVSRSPAVKFGAAKILQGANRATIPVLNRTGLLPSLLNQMKNRSSSASQR